MKHKSNVIIIIIINGWARMILVLWFIYDISYQLEN